MSPSGGTGRVAGPPSCEDKAELCSHIAAYQLLALAQGVGLGCSKGQAPCRLQ